MIPDMIGRVEKFAYAMLAAFVAVTVIRCTTDLGREVFQTVLHVTVHVLKRIFMVFDAGRRRAERAEARAERAEGRVERELHRANEADARAKEADARADEADARALKAQQSLAKIRSLRIRAQ